MIRDEKDLLVGLINAMNSMYEEDDKKNKKNYNIEDYRDEDGFINLTKLTNMDELKEIVDIVNKKNASEMADNDIFCELADELLPLLGLDSFTINIETPNGKETFEIGKKTNEEPLKEKNNEEPLKEKTNENSLKEKTNEEPLKETTTVNKEPETKGCNCSCENKKTEEKKQQIDNRSVLLINAGGTYNPCFYNSVHYICENKYFKKCGVYKEDDIHPESIDVFILLPNIFKKILLNVADDFSEYVKTEKEVYLIDPETFELTKIDSSLQLYNSSMTDLQEEFILSL